MKRTVTSALQHPQAENENCATEPFPANTSAELREGFEEYPRATFPSQVVADNFNSSMVNSTTANRLNVSARECEVLYKELKHQHTNTLGRFIILTLCTLVPSIFFHSTGISSTQWLVVRYNGQFRALGVFLMCHEGISNVCLKRGTSLELLKLWESDTSGDTCKIHRNTMWYFLVFMYILALIQIALVAVTLLLVIRMTRRPTRCKTALVAMCTIALSVPCGVITAVLFYYYTQCKGKLCETVNLGDDCTANYKWGYNFHIAATTLDFVAFIFCVCLYTYPHSFRAWARKMLKDRQERLDRARARCMSMDTVEHRESRKKNKGYLTAADLSIKIEGASADKWVYDALSDYFYCFELDAFWDPLSREYYCRTLQIWQTTPVGLDMYRGLLPSWGMTQPPGTQE